MPTAHCTLLHHDGALSKPIILEMVACMEPKVNPSTTRANNLRQKLARSPRAILRSSEGRAAMVVLCMVPRAPGDASTTFEFLLLSCMSLSPQQAGYLEQLRETAKRLGATIAFDPIGGAFTGQLVEALPRGSQILVYGALSAEDARVDPRKLIFDNKQIEGFWFSDWTEKKGTWQTISCVRKAMKGSGVDWTSEVAERVPLEDVHEALLRYERQMTRGKVLIVPSPSRH